MSDNYGPNCYFIVTTYLTLAVKLRRELVPARDHNTKQTREKQGCRVTNLAGRKSLRNNQQYESGRWRQRGIL